MSYELKNNYVDQILTHIRKKYPEIECLEIIDTPDTRDSKTIFVKAPDDDDIQLDIMETASEIAMDILLEKGKHFLVVPMSNSNNVEI